MNLQDLKNKFDIIGNAPSLNYALTTAERVATTDLTVLIMGESGTGKEVFSKIIHQLSARKHGQFIAINCGAIPEGTIDSELFGHEKGSFTGAGEKRKGYFETVDGGTIFLDEIAEMPLGTQSRLLRLLQNGEFIKVGSSQIQKVDVRVVAATNVNLIEAVQKGKFREDLYYRLNTVPIEVPPLRDREDDIVLLFRKFSSDFCLKNRIQPKILTEEGKTYLKQFRWPGNIRQLKSVAEQVNLLNDSSTIDVIDLERFIPISVQSLYKSNVTNQNYASNSEDISIKMLLDIKQDIHDIKRLFVELSMNSNQNFEKYRSNIDEKLMNYESQTQHYNPNNVIELPESNITLNTNRSVSKEELGTLNLVEMEKKYILLALKRHKGKRKNAADELGISERTLYRKIIDFDIDE